jgi:hypothetical protein
MAEIVEQLKLKLMKLSRIESYQVQSDTLTKVTYFYVSI